MVENVGTKKFIVERENGTRVAGNNGANRAGNVHKLNFAQQYLRSR